MPPAPTCPRCQRPLPADAAGGLCPACALDAALNLSAPTSARAPAPRAPLRRKRLLHYQILGKIGEGGMGVVYKARDTRLDRLVAIKILPADKVGDPERRRRFIAEAKAASALNHPNIVTIYEVAASAGVHFIAMEFIAGRTLDQLVGRNGLPPDQILLYAIPIAGALARAHDAGIIHRDLKPQNIMVRDDGLVKLLDFGLAKLGEAAPSSDRGSELGVPPSGGPKSRSATRPAEAGTPYGGRPVAGSELGVPPSGGPGSHEDPLKRVLRTPEPALTEATRIMGTPGFMAPEQIEGRKVDGRADLFAFGAVLYHALSGRKPFGRTTADETFAAILREDPAPLENVPGPLAAIVARCLKKDPAERFSSAGELQAALRAATSGTAADKPDPSIAVLPFAVLGSQPEEDYFGDALAGEIITALTRVRGLKVIGRTSSRLVGAEGLEPRTIGERLGVAHLLEGTVQRSESTLRVAARLLRATDGTCLWAESFDRTPADVFAIQNEIAKAITASLRVAPQNRGPLVRQATDNLEAYHLYLLGRQAFELRAENYLTEARERFEQAIRLDPNFVPAHLTLAEVWWYVALWGFAAPREAILHGVWSVLRALQLDDQLADAHALLAMYRHLSDFNLAEARREIDRARALDATSPLVRLGYVTSVLIPFGRFAEACTEFEAINLADPFSYGTRSWLTAWLQFDRRHEATIAECRQIIAQEPRFPLSYQIMGLSLEWMGRHDAALAALQQYAEFSGRTHHAVSDLGWIHARMGRTEEARRLLAELHERTRTGYVPPSALAMIYIGLGEIDLAMDWLERGIEARDSYLTALKWWPIYDPVRGHPRYPQLLRKMNLEP